jgi:glutamate racemase
MKVSQNRTKAIGVFDSGLGGLTVARAIRNQLPSEDIVFLGDIARVPYGSRSSSTVCKYAQACAKTLHEQNIKVLVVACNTVSAVALELLRKNCNYPVLGVIEPGAREGANVTPGGHIGVIATHRTVASGGYEKAIKLVDSTIKITSNPAPLLVPLAEEGWVDGEVAKLVIQRYLEPLVSVNIDTLILGCTHYPLLRHTIEEQLEKMSGRQLPVVDSALATAKELQLLLEKSGLSCQEDTKGSLTILVTDMPEKFSETAMRFLDGIILKENIIQVDI